MNELEVSKPIIALLPDRLEPERIKNCHGNSSSESSTPFTDRSQLKFKPARASEFCLVISAASATVFASRASART